ncbi:MAG: methyltransferase [Pseudomonadota bacterium]
MTLAQPKSGYRAATDPVLLAAAIPAKDSDQVLDVGCGVGTAALCLGVRVDVELVGLELSHEYAALGRQNSYANGIMFQVIEGDLFDMPSDLRTQEFDHVMTNPPFYDAGKGSDPDNALKADAHVMGQPLSEWIAACLRRVKSGGTFTIIMRAEKLDEILAATRTKLGAIQALPIAPRAGAPAKRVIVQGIKGRQTPMKLLAPLIMHQGTQHEKDGDSYTKEARSILREGSAIRTMTT